MLESWFPLFHEGSHAFLLILSGERGLEHSSFESFLFFVSYHGGDGDFGSLRVVSHCPVLLFVSGDRPDGVTLSLSVSVDGFYDVRTVFVLVHETIRSI